MEEREEGRERKEEGRRGIKLEEDSKEKRQRETERGRERWRGGRSDKMEGERRNDKDEVAQ